MVRGIGFALAGMSIELWAVMMGTFGGNGGLAFMTGTIGLGIGLAGGLLAEVPPSSRSMPSTA